MARRIFWLGALLAAQMLAAVAAAETISVPKIIIDGSIPLQYETNAARTSNKQPDYVFSPFLRLSATGQLMNDFVYSLYANTTGDQDIKLTDEDTTQAAAGLQISRTWGAFRLGASYERTNYYNSIYGSQLNSANDMQVFARYNYMNPDGDVRITPSFSVTTRTDDHFTVERNLFRFRADFEHRLGGSNWWVFAVPSLRIYDYTSGRLDDIYSIATGLRYEITRDVSLTSSVAYESRVSSQPGRNYTNMIVGLSLDFSYTLFGGGGSNKTLEPTVCENPLRLLC